ncbi:hypothetical protein MASR2M66_08780 [Chloroflexota bacterium]
MENAVDPNAPPHFQALGAVLQRYMSGIKELDLSGLPAEIAQVVKEALSV